MTVQENQSHHTSLPGFQAVASLGLHLRVDGTSKLSRRNADVLDVLAYPAASSRALRKTDWIRDLIT
ncbi:MAG: hypothetical protein AAF732_09890 [Pseudomonadota bacterium]